jgi:hypothetical protein
MQQLMSRQRQLLMKMRPFQRFISEAFLITQLRFGYM